MLAPNVTRICCVLYKKDVLSLVLQMCSGEGVLIWNGFCAKQETSSNFILSLNEILLECVLESRLKNLKCLSGSYLWSPRTNVGIYSLYVATHTVIELHLTQSLRKGIVPRVLSTDLSSELCYREQK